MKRGWVVVTGCSSGLGRATCEALVADGHPVFGLDVRADPGTGVISDGRTCDVRSASDVEGAAAYLEDQGREIAGIINCAGINHIEWLGDLMENDWDRVMDTNAKGIYLMSRFFLPALEASQGFLLNIVSNAAHIPMRCSLAYNASKGAAHIMTLQLARELSSKGITVFGIAPNRMGGTIMSEYIDDRVLALRGWTKEQAQQYQLSSLLAGAETPPSRVAEFIAFLLGEKERHRYLTGCILPYGA